ncbi:MAG: macro domain-containing protein [Chloroflexi bacterium]|nr:macro domain-containing protein [Chloroflexota bacterium]
MTITFSSGDLFATPDVDAYAHGVNCAGAMGAGIAVEFKKRYPKMYKQYNALCKNGGLQPGDVFAWHGRGVTVFNLATQQHWKTHATLEAVENSVTKTLKLAANMGISEIVLPRIGAGLGGLEWSDVKSLLIELAGEHHVTLLVAEEFIAGKSLRE